MKIPHEIFKRYPIEDGDTAMFVNAFDEPKGSKVLEVGAHDEPVANMLTELAFNVVGVDLREYNPNQDTGVPHKGAPPPYKYLRADFCDLPVGFLEKYLGTFDVIVSLSAIEHFGLSTYHEGPPHPYYDVIAMRTMWQLLREGGVAYISVPFGAKHYDRPPDYRIYNEESLRLRLIQDFTAEWINLAVVAGMDIFDKIYSWDNQPSTEEMLRYDGDIPHITALVKLRKDRVRRLAPDGR